jgi:hypothetical protein
MYNRDRLFTKNQGPIWNTTSAIAGATVLGLAFAFAGPFLTILFVIASIIYGAVITFRIMASKMASRMGGDNTGGSQDGMREWG